MNVLILSARAPVALEWARHFQGASWRVFLADHQAGRLSCQNVLPHTFIPTPAAAQNPQAYIHTLAQAIRTHKIDWLIPTCEEIFYLAKFQDSLPQSCRILCADFETLQTLHNKYAFNQLAQNLGLYAPASVRLQNSHDLSWEIDTARIVKPLFSRFGHQVLALAAQQPIPAHIPLDGSWLVQECVQGQEYCSYSLALSGRLLAHQSYQGLYRYKKGASFYFDPVAHDGIKKQVKRVVEALNFSGQISFDWMVNEDNQAFVLECNPAATSGLHLLPHNGSLLNALLNETPIANYQPKAKMLLPMMYLHALPQAAAQGTLKKWYQDYQRADDVLQHWSHHVGSLQDAYYFYRVCRQQNIPLEAATAVDFAWNGD